MKKEFEPSIWMDLAGDLAVPEYQAHIKKISHLYIKDIPSEGTKNTSIMKSGCCRRNGRCGSVVEVLWRMWHAVTRCHMHQSMPTPMLNKYVANWNTQSLNFKFYYFSFKLTRWKQCNSLHTRFDAKTWHSHPFDIRAGLFRSCFDFQAVCHKYATPLASCQLYNVMEDEVSYVHSFTPKVASLACWPEADGPKFTRSSQLPTTRQHSCLHINTT